MEMTLQQTKLVGLTMELELKTKEYAQLGKELESLKSQNLDSNDNAYVELLRKFAENQKEIKDIVEQLKALQ